MGLTPDRFPGRREESEVKYRDRATDGDPTDNGAVRYRSDVGGGVLRLKTETSVVSIPGSVTAHAGDHITGGADEVDGDKLDIDWNPTNYTPTTAPTEVDSVDNLTAHLAGIDAQIGAPGGPHAATHIRGGTDEIDGDRIDIDFDPADPSGSQAVDYGYAPDTSADEVDNAEHLTAHLQGINDKWIDFALRNAPAEPDNNPTHTYTGTKLTLSEWKRDSDSSLLKSIANTYTGTKLTASTVKIFANDGTTIVGHVDRTLTYTGSKLTGGSEVRVV